MEITNTLTKNTYGTKKGYMVYYLTQFNNGTEKVYTQNVFLHAKDILGVIKQFMKNKKNSSNGTGDIYQIIKVVEYDLHNSKEVLN